MDDYRININYAKALFLVASETQQLDAVSNDMRLVNGVCTENHILNVIFSNPVIREDKKVAVLNDLFQQHITKLSMLFLSFVVKKRRAINLKGISNAFIELYREERGIVLSRLVTATELDNETLDSVRKALEEYTHKEVELQSDVKEDILGGFSLSFDNNKYDATISSQIAKLQKEFSKNVYESKL